MPVRQVNPPVPVLLAAVAPGTAEPSAVRPRAVRDVLDLSAGSSSSRPSSCTPATAAGGLRTIWHRGGPVPEKWSPRGYSPGISPWPVDAGPVAVAP